MPAEKNTKNTETSTEQSPTIQNTTPIKPQSPSGQIHTESIKPTSPIGTIFQGNDVIKDDSSIQLNDDN